MDILLRKWCLLISDYSNVLNIKLRLINTHLLIGEILMHEYLYTKGLNKILRYANITHYSVPFFFKHGPALVF